MDDMLERINYEVTLNRMNYEINCDKLKHLLGKLDDNDLYSLDVYFEICQFHSVIQVMDDMIIAKTPAELYLRVMRKAKNYFKRELTITLLQDIENHNILQLKIMEH